MAFVNEYISATDIKKYDIENINRRFVVGGTRARDWTIDREREIYLRNVANGREEFSRISTWTLYWGGNLITLELENLGTSGQPGEMRHGRKRLRRIEIPTTLDHRRTEILADLRDALTVYKDGGVFATATDYTLTLEI
jgi:hypothetical protein